MGHEDTKVVTEISASDTQSPHGGNDKCLTRSEERNSSGLDSRVTEYGEGRLVLDSTKEQVVSESRDGKDGNCQKVAADQRGLHNFGDGLVTVFISCHKVPEDRVESGHGNKGVQAGLGFKQLVKFIDGGRDGGSSVPESGVKKVGAGNP